MAIEKVRRKDGSHTFKVRVKDQAGNWYNTPTFHSLEDAKLEEARLMDQKRKGKKAISQDARLVTYNEYWDVWSVENRTDVSEGWKISQNQMNRDFIAPVIGGRKLISIGKPEVGQVLNRMKRMGKSEQLRKHVYSLLRKIFGDAVDYYEMLNVNPVNAKFHRPKVPQTKRTFLEPEDAFKLLDHVKGTYMGPPTWLMMLSALRISEVQALRGSSLMYPQGQILICAAFNNKTGELQAYPKQEDWAYSPMPPALKEYLQTLNRGPEDFVAPGIKGGMLPYETYLQTLRRVCMEAGVKVITPHELRHSSTEIWVRAGASTEDLRRLLNHGTLSSTMRYIHRTDARLTEVGKGLRLVGNPNSPKSSPIGEKQTYAPAVQGVQNVH